MFIFFCTIIIKLSPVCYERYFYRGQGELCLVFVYGCNIEIPLSSHFIGFFPITQNIVLCYMIQLTVYYKLYNIFLSQYTYNHYKYLVLHLGLALIRFLTDFKNEGSYLFNPYVRMFVRDYITIEITNFDTIFRKVFITQEQVLV